MSMQTSLVDTFERLIDAIVILKTRTGDLTTLNTTDKTNLVAALNEVKSSMTSLIDDASTTATNKVWSVSKTKGYVDATITSLINGAPGSQDTLNELAAQITALLQADQGLLNFKAAQTLTTAEKQQAGANMGIGDPTHDYLTAVNTALTAQEL